ncbi:peptidoglycan/LPS O-acetylase OafA/YrhL [Actinoplanes lutulentus]|uniref:Peptidoglycan/LPS O-acetylase OafA/YrhL n=1 Tax=Actinoplanes lutulentus TaxID=1287878 RepID=A0A327YZ42_9ACTN|nr:acyltransferase family protein [Actinoplanes lutulentus]RAK26278.1 peptidoglycan/LPS O-acetylase OafA/YrhL [Actinoplanes lutulentus]
MWFGTLVSMTVARRPELDAIRLTVVLGLVFFHTSLVFDARDDFYIKNSQTTEVTTYLAGLGVVWAMPALFLIAGFGSWHSLRRRGTRGFLVERGLRLGVPLLFAIVTLLPLPPYLRLRALGSDESYPRFLARYLTVHLDVTNFPFIVRGDEFETGHLWFVVLLLTFSLLVPLAARVPSAGGLSGAASGAEFGALFARRGMVLVLPAVPIVVVTALVGMEEAFAGWSRWAYLLFFAYGLLLAADDRVRAAMRRDARVSAVIGVVLFGVVGVLIATYEGDFFTDMTPHALVTRTVFGLTGWLWIVAILGLLDRPRSRDPSLPSVRRAYLGEAALPLYILHQPIVVAVAYVVVRWQWPMIAKYAVIVAISFAVMFTVYELLVRRFRATRFLFGTRERHVVAHVRPPSGSPEI